MLFKLSYRNIKRSIRDYSIYLITISIAFSLIYSFNMLLFSDDIQSLSQMMNSFSMIIIFVSMLVVFVIGWLICYMTRFMLEKRCREFGTYMVLGINNRNICNMFLLENAGIGLFAFLIGIAAGTLLYQIFIAIIMKLFEASYQVKIAFSLRALLLSLLYSVLIFLFSMLRNRHRLKKMQIYDLLNTANRNEEIKVKSNLFRWFLFLFSLLLGVAGLVFFRYTLSNEDTLKMNRILTCFILILICLYGSSIGLSSIIIKLFLNKKNRYKKEHLFLFRNLSSKFSKMSITLGTLSFLITVTLISIETGMIFKGAFDELAASEAPFDILIGLSEGKDRDFSPYLDYLEDHITIEKQKPYQIYENGSHFFYDLLQDTPLGGAYIDKDLFLKYSDYSALREYLGYQPVELKEDSYIIHCMKGAKKYFEKKPDLSLSIGDTQLKYQGSMTEAFSQSGKNGAYYIIVLPDEMIENMSVYQNNMVIMTKEDTTEKLYNDMIQTLQDNESLNIKSIYIPFTVTVRGAVLAENRTMFTIFSFSLFYLGLIFTSVAATVLAVQMLTDSAKYKYRYDILSMLGKNRDGINSIILHQLIIYFGMPLVLPIMISISVSKSINQIFSGYLGNELFLKYIPGAVGLFLLTYLMYFLATYTEYRKIVSD